MKEIDFLPEWYKNGRRRQLSYRTQCIALAAMFTVFMVWNFVSLNSISNATSKLAKMASEQPKAQNASKEFTKIKNEVTELRTKANILKDIDSKIDLASVLAEMSFLISEDIVLSKIEFIGERFLDKQQSEAKPAAAVRVVGTEIDKKQEQPLGDVRFKVVIIGIAADSSDVAALVCKLEESPYFSLVNLLFSRNKTIQMLRNSAMNNETEAKTTHAEENYQVSEFEIRCYLANYRQDKS